MSTNLECLYFSTNDKWYYVLQRYDCPVGAWDWREYADCVGPFASEDAASKYLHEHNANPGGALISRDAKIDDVLQGLIDNAQTPVVYRRRHW